MKHATLLLFLVTATLTHGQNFPLPTTGARWVNTLYGVEPFPPPAVFTLLDVQNLCTFGNDTAINTTTYTKLEFCLGGYKGAFRNDAGRVYYVPGGTSDEHLIYDFTLQAGESAEVYYEQALDPTLGFTQEVTVSSTEVRDDLGGRRALYLQEGATWIEGIGNTWGLLTEPWINVSNYMIELECMSYADTLRFPLLVPDAGECELIMDVDAISTSTMNLHPNPTADGRVTVSGLEPGGIWQVTVRSADGRIVHTDRATGAERLSLDLGGLPSGSYLMEVNGDRQRYRGTVLRQ